MQNHKRIASWLRGVWGCVGLMFFCMHALSAYAQGTTLNFHNAEIEAVARTIAVITKRNVVVDPRVKGTMTLVSESPVSRAQAYNQFLSALRLQGFTVVQASGIYKVVPEAEAKHQAGQGTVVGPNESNVRAGSQMLTQIFRLNHESANNVLPILRPLIAPNNTININPGNNTLVITDYAENLQRLSRIIAALDLPATSGVEIIALKHVIAAEAAPLVSRLLEGGGATAATPAAEVGRTLVLADSSSNALIVRAASAARAALARSLIAQLDQPSLRTTSEGAGNIYVVYLKNAEATKLALTLRAALAANAALGGTGGGAGATVVQGMATAGASPSSLGGGNPGTAPIAASAIPSTGGQIQADPATNSLIITASEPQYRQLRAVIEKLDSRRAQVFVESLIAEVNEDKAAEFGVQWQGVLGQKGDTNLGVIGTNFGTGGNNIINLSTQGATGTVTPGTGFNFGIGHMTNGRYVLGFLARFLETSGAGNVLSTPNLLTLDNEEARIVIGQNVPFVTGQYTNNTTAGAANPFQTIERKDVGLTLRVKPQISENGTVRMTIYQEVSSVSASSIGSAQGLITNKRSIESNVLVEDGSIVVLGGLLQDSSSTSQERVPGLSSIPILGALFRSESRQRTKTNLMVFLRPVVVRDGISSEGLSLSRYDYMRGVQQEINVRQLNVPQDQAVPLPREDLGRLGGSLMPERLPKLRIERQFQPASAAPGVQK